MTGRGLESPPTLCPLRWRQVGPSRRQMHCRDREKPTNPNHPLVFLTPSSPRAAERTPKADPHPSQRLLRWGGFAFPPGFRRGHVTSTKPGAPAERRGRGGIWDPEVRREGGERRK